MVHGNDVRVRSPVKANFIVITARSSVFFIGKDFKGILFVSGFGLCVIDEEFGFVN